MTPAHIRFLIALGSAVKNGAVKTIKQGGLIPHPEDYKDEKIIKTKRVYY